MTKKETTAITVSKPKKLQKQDNSVNEFITQAISNNLPVETMEKLFALREKVKAEHAREAFVTALSGFQGECPVIQKTKIVLNKDGKTVRYKFAPIDSIVEQIKKPLVKYGLSYTWKVINEPGFITAIAIVTHELGHSQESDFKVPIDTEGYMTAPQKYASALTFAKRYSLCNALGISTGEEDTDATDVEEEKEVKSQKSKIIFLLKALGYKPDTREIIQKTVKELTQLEVEDENLVDIIDRLEILVKEKQEYDQSKL